MRTRDTRFDDYDITKIEEERLRLICRSADRSTFLALYRAAYRANPQIAREITFSLAFGLSYERMDQKALVPISQNDFYGYRRLTLALFRDIICEEAKV